MRARRPPWQPDSGELAGPQRRFLVELGHVFELLNAGEVGSGKTDAALMAPVVYPEYRKHPRFKGIMLRFSAGNKVKVGDAFAEFFQRIEEPGRWRRYVGGRLNRTDGIYRYKSGGQVFFTSTRDLRSLHGPEFQLVYADELTHWPEPADYLYVAFTRARSSGGLPVRVRASTNAFGPGKAWVRSRWGPWLARDYLSRNAEGDIHAGAASLRALGYQERRDAAGELLAPCQSGEVLHFLLAEDGSETWVAAGTPGALTRSCLRTRTVDNLALMRSDPTYSSRTRAVGATMGAQLARDDWDLRIGEGVKYFDRSKVKIVTEVPPLVGVVSRWDFGWTKKRKSDYSVRVKLGWTAGRVLYPGGPQVKEYVILHMLRIKGLPDQVFKAVRQTAEADGRGVRVVVPIDFSSGLVVASDVAALLDGWVVKAVRESGQGTKDVRISTLQAPIEAERFSALRGGWNDAFLDELGEYPEVAHDDQLDGLAGAFLEANDPKQAPEQEEIKEDLQRAQRLVQRLESAWEEPERSW